jgi:hypothetical protein
MDFNVFEDMLLNQNTNECRSTYYPHQAWTLYKPDQFKTGLVHNLKKIEDKIEELKNGQSTISHFTPAMFDYRNLLNFHILDELDKRDLLKEEHHSKV